MAEGQKRQKLAGCSSSTLTRARMGAAAAGQNRQKLPGCYGSNLARALTQCYSPIHHTEQEYSCSPEVMFSAPPLSLFTNLLYAAVYFLQLQLWLMLDLITLAMAACQPHLGAREGLEPLGSALEDCRGQVKWFDIN